MAFTDFADIYTALHDAGINRVVKLLMLQRPSLFNYGTASVRNNPELLCAPIHAHPTVSRLITLLDPLPIVGSSYLGVDYCVQITDLKFDFYPPSGFSLPADIGPLANQQFALKITACVGLSCAARRFIDTKIPLRPQAKYGLLRSSRKNRMQPTYPDFPSIQQQRERLRDANFQLGDRHIFTPPEIQVIPPERMECFCLNIYATGGISIIGTVPNQSLVLNLEKIEIEDITPGGLENALECYFQTALERAVLPPLLSGVSELLFSPVSLGPSGELLFSASTSAPNNPAIEENQLKVHVNLDSFSFTLPEPGDDSEPWPEPDFRYQRTRSRTDAFDLTTAVNEKTLREVFQVVGNQFTWSDYGTGSFGPFSASYGIAVSVHDSDLELRSDHQLVVGFRLDVDTLYVNFGINIPEISIPGFCLVPPGFPKRWCAVWIPGTTLFEANPDLVLPLDISGILELFVTFTGIPVVYYGEGAPNRWMLFIDPDPDLTNFNVEGIADIPGTLLENIIDAAIESLGLPGWAEDVIETILGPLVDVINGILGITGDVALWILNFIGNTLRLWNLLKAALLEYLGSTTPLFQFPDPLPVIPAQPPEIEVKVPVTFLGVRVNDTELILQADIGENI